jgi:hypothetical protein
MPPEEDDLTIDSAAEFRAVWVRASRLLRIRPQACGVFAICFRKVL